MRVSVGLMKDASHLCSADESEQETLSQRVFEALTPNEQELNFLSNEYSMVSEDMRSFVNALGTDLCFRFLRYSVFSQADW